mgnify:CR=1 FL=1
MIEPKYNIMMLVQPQLGVNDPELSPRIDRVIDAVINVRSLDKNKFFSKIRNREYVYARRTVAYILRDELNLTLYQIKKALRRDHSTIHAGLKWFYEHKDVFHRDYPEIYEMMYAGRRALC